MPGASAEVAARIEYLITRSVSCQGTLTKAAIRLPPKLPAAAAPLVTRKVDWSSLGPQPLPGQSTVII